MKKYIYVLIIPFLFSFVGQKKPDCRKFYFGATMDEVKKGETLRFVKDEPLIHNVQGLIFMEMTDTAMLVYTYTFYQKKLNGMRIKYQSKIGNDDIMTATKVYENLLNKYRAIAQGKIDDKKGQFVQDKVDAQNLRSFTIRYQNKYYSVALVKEYEAFFVTEDVKKK